MRNLNLDWDDEDRYYDYTPNELARLPDKLYREIVQSNLDEGDTVEQWEKRNLKDAQQILEYQRRNR